MTDPRGLRRRLDAAASRLMAYPFRRWGFGEDIGLRGLQAYGQRHHDGDLVSWVWRLLVEWGAARPPMGYEHHVTPGVALLDAHLWQPHERLWDAALRLGALYASFPSVDGIPIHRGDLHTWKDTIWVDCMALDAPFLVRLGNAMGDARWTDLGLTHIHSYARVLQDRATGLFRHGYDVSLRTPSRCHWGRGNGWALHGLVDTLEALPDDHAGRDPLAAYLTSLVTCLANTQGSNGMWHTILDDPTTPLEASTAALFASALRKAVAARLLPPRLVEPATASITLAERAMTQHLAEDGSFRVSAATPIGDRTTYAHQPLGNFPWGHGPLLLWAAEVPEHHLIGVRA